MDYSQLDMNDPDIRAVLAEDYASKNDLDINDPDIRAVLDDHFMAMAPKEGKWNPLGAAGDVGKLVYDIPTQVKGAIGNMMEESDPLAQTDWKDRWAKEAEQRTQERKQGLIASGGANDRVLPGTDFLSRGDIADTSASTGFSLTAMAPSVAGTALAATGIGAPAGIALGMAGSGAAAYKMDKTMFTRQLLEKANAEMMQDSGRVMTTDEREQYLAATDDVRSDHALWEAGPEAVGNAIGMFGLGKVFKGVAGKALKTAVVGALTNYAGEVSTETVTQMGQQRAESSLGLTEESPRDWLSHCLFVMSSFSLNPRAVCRSSTLYPRSISRSSVS